MGYCGSALPFLSRVDSRCPPARTESDRHYIFIAYYDDSCVSILWRVCTSLIWYLQLLVVCSWSVPLWISPYRIVSERYSLGHCSVYLLYVIEILFGLHSIHCDVFLFALIVLFLAYSVMQGQIVAGVRFYNSPPKWLMYMNTSAATMLVFMYNNATAIAFILSLIYIMAPHVEFVEQF